MLRAGCASLRQFSQTMSAGERLATGFRFEYRGCRAIRFVPDYHSHADQIRNPWMASASPRESQDRSGSYFIWSILVARSELTGIFDGRTW